MAQGKGRLVAAALVHLDAGCRQHLHPAMFAVKVGLTVDHGGARSHVDGPIHHVLHLARVGEGAMGHKLGAGPIADLEMHQDPLHALLGQHAKAEVHRHGDLRSSGHLYPGANPIRKLLRPHAQPVDLLAGDHLVAADHQPRHAGRAQRLGIATRLLVRGQDGAKVAHRGPPPPRARCDRRAGSNGHSDCIPCRRRRSPPPAPRRSATPGRHGLPSRRGG